MKTIMVLLMLLPFAGCRQTGMRIEIRNSPGATVTVPGSRMDSQQGKTVTTPVDIGRAAKLSGLPGM